MGRGALSGQTRLVVTRTEKVWWHYSYELCWGKGSIPSPWSWQCFGMKKLHVLWGQAQ